MTGTASPIDDAAQRIVRSRLAILAQIRRGGPAADRPWPAAAATAGSRSAGACHPGGRPWLAGLQRAARTWWQAQPARVLAGLAMPLLASYARRKPVQLVLAASLTGAAVAVTRPWRWIPVTGLALALIKSSRMSTLVMSALSAADFQTDQDRPE